jgi:hypothetical protein
MIELINVKKESEIARSLKQKELTIFIAISLFVFSGVTLAIVFSKEEYTLLLWILIAVLTLYIWGTLYFFSVPFKQACRYDRFYQSALKGLLSEDTVEVRSLVTGNISKDGLEAKQLVAQFKENGKTYERDFYLLKGQLNLKEGTRIKAESFSGVLLAYEVLS